MSRFDRIREKLFDERWQELLWVLFAAWLAVVFLGWIIMKPQA
jgi:hypothetical protein